MSLPYVPEIRGIIRGTTLLLVILGLIGLSTTLDHHLENDENSGSTFSSRDMFFNVSRKLVSQPEVVGSNTTIIFHKLYAPEAVSAFVIPSGQVFVTTGLLDRLESEEQVAAVLAHEMGHYLMNHFDGWHELPYLSLDEDPPNPAEIHKMQSHIHEFEADFWGMCLLMQAGYDPESFIGMLEILERYSEEDNRITNPSTHPLLADRISRIQENLNHMDLCFPQAGEAFGVSPGFEAP
jgi:Zn-dependent protease with chaperone function